MQPPNSQPAGWGLLLSLLSNKKPLCMRETEQGCFVAAAARANGRNGPLFTLKLRNIGYTAQNTCWQEQHVCRHSTEEPYLLAVLETEVFCSFGVFKIDSYICTEQVRQVENVNTYWSQTTMSNDVNNGPLSPQIILIKKNILMCCS